MFRVLILQHRYNLSDDGLVYQLRDRHSFMRFLGLLGAKEPLVLVVYGHPIHKAKLLNDFVEQQEGSLKLVFLPPYAPQVKPDEQVWGYIKPRVHVIFING